MPEPVVSSSSVGRTDFALDHGSGSGENNN
jgi:hypothetical protein